MTRHGLIESTYAVGSVPHRLFQRIHTDLLILLGKVDSHIQIDCGVHPKILQVVWNPPHVHFEFIDPAGEDEFTIVVGNFSR